MNKKKRLIIFFSKLSIGGMERALVDFIRMSDISKKYDVILYVGYVIEKSYLDEIEKCIKVRVICPSKWNIVGKIKTYFIMNFDYLRLFLSKGKYDCSICYTYHHKILSKLARVASKNNILFVHTDLYKSRTKDELKKLTHKVKLDQFSKVVCVSNCAKESFRKIYPNYSGKLIMANNYIDGKYIISKSKEKVDDYKFVSPVFINVARHFEKGKQISFIIEASKRLKEKNYSFNVLLVGDGESHEYYQELISKYDLSDRVTLLGSRINPYKYLVNSDALLFTSKFEGYGVVLDEARVLNIPIITTDVADAKIITDDGYGYICENSIEGVYLGMKRFIDEGYNTKKFDYEKFNANITKIINDTIE